MAVSGILFVLYTALFAHGVHFVLYTALFVHDSLGRAFCALYGTKLPCMKTVVWSTKCTSSLHQMLFCSLSAEPYAWLTTDQMDCKGSSRACSGCCYNYPQHECTGSDECDSQDDLIISCSKCFIESICVTEIVFDALFSPSPYHLSLSPSFSPPSSLSQLQLFPLNLHSFSI